MVPNPLSSKQDDQIIDLIGSCVFGKEWVELGFPENFEAAKVNVNLLEKKIKTLLAQLVQLHGAEVAELADKIFIDFPTAHKITAISLVHEPECSSKQGGFMCDCSVLKAAQYAVNTAKERIKAQLQPPKEKK